MDFKVHLRVVGVKEGHRRGEAIECTITHDPPELLNLQNFAEVIIEPRR